MWFKNAHLFCLTEPLSIDTGEFNQLLSKKPARQCGNLERMTLGWGKLLEKETDFEFCLQTEQCFLFALEKYEKILPQTVVRDHVADRVAEIEKQQDRSLGKREKRALMEEMLITLLPQAFSKRQRLHAYLDIKLGLLIVDTSSTTKAEELVIFLKQTIPQLKCQTVKVKRSVDYQLTDWLKNDTTPAGFQIEDYVEFHDPDSAKTLIKCVNQNLYTPEIAAHLKAGKEVIKLGLSYKDRMAFIVDPELGIRKLEYLDEINDQLEQVEIESRYEQLLTEFSLLSLELREMLPKLFKAFGGLDLRQPKTEELAQEPA